MLFTWNCWSSALLLFHFLAKFLRNHSYCILLPPLPLQGQSFTDQGKQWVCTASSPDIMKYSFVDLSCQLTQMNLLRDLGCFLECALIITGYKMLCNVNTVFPSTFCVFLMVDKLHHQWRQDLLDQNKPEAWLLHLSKSPWLSLQAQKHFQGISHLILKQMRWAMALNIFPSLFTVAGALHNQLRGRYRHYKPGDMPHFLYIFLGQRKSRKATSLLLLISHLWS